MGAVHADLMGSSGFQATLDNGCSDPETLYDGVMRPGLFSLIVGDDSHFLSIAGATADTAFDSAFRGRRAPDNGGIRPVDAVLGKLLGKTGMGCIVLCDNEQSAGVLVYTVDDSRPPHAAHTGKTLPTMRQECINKRTVIVAGRGVYDETNWLIHDKYVFIFISDIERYCLRQNMRRRRLGHRNRQRDSRFHLIRGIGYRFRARDYGAFFDQCFGPRSRQCRKGTREQTIEAIANLGLGNVVDQYLLVHNVISCASDRHWTDS